MFKHGIGTQTRKGTTVKEVAFALVVIGVHVVLGGIVLLGIIFISDQINPRPDSVFPHYFLGAHKGP